MPATLLTTFGLTLCAGAVVLQLPHLYLIAVHLRRGRRELARERELIALRVGASLAEYPPVCVQLPVFNETELVGAAIDSLCALDWPREQLEVMVLDGSTDGTSEIVAARAAAWRESGRQIVHVRGDHSQTFKAGALRDGFERTRAPYIAIFDVDYRPAPTFLRETIPVLLAEPRASFLQARLDARNRNRNWLTRAQAVESDTFRVFEQAARNWAGVPMTCNGTCAVWRRQAIDEAGGWSSRTLVEDHDLSYRAFALGWTCLNSVATAAAGELPETFAVLATQRQRWSAGTAQVFRLMPWRLVRHLGPLQAAVFVLLQLFYAFFPMVVVAIAVVVLASGLTGQSGTSTLAISLVAVLGAHVLLRGAGAALAQRLLDRPLGRRFVADLVYLSLMELALLLRMVRSLAAGFLGQRIPFVRTSKTGR